MIGMLFGVNILVALSVGLTMTMLQNHFSKIKKSTYIYGDPKAYKPYSDIAFIDSIIEQVRGIAEKDEEDESLEDMANLINQKLMTEKIGVFKYQVVARIAMQGKYLIWIVLIGQIILEMTSKKPGESISDFIYIVGSTLLCMLVTLAGVVNNLTDQKTALIEEIQQYILDTYPRQREKRHKQNELREILDRMDRVAFNAESAESEQLESEQEELHLAEEDIKIFLRALDKEA
ncbi:MAG: hypothetical protein ACRCWY_02715 [Cellulosilyticaceae bacterium]